MFTGWMNIRDPDHTFVSDQELNWPSETEDIGTSKRWLPRAQPGYLGTLGAVSCGTRGLLGVGNRFPMAFKERPWKPSQEN